MQHTCMQEKGLRKERRLAVWIYLGFKDVPYIEAILQVVLSYYRVVT